MAEALTLWLVRVAIVCYAVAAAIVLGRVPHRRALAAARLAWTVGCALFLLHVVAAFAVYHHWSHAAALEHTAQRTFDTIGVRTGVGLYVNYLFAAVWVADVVDWWIVGCARYVNRPRAATLALHAFFLFMVFNATVVFATGIARWLGAVVTLVVVGAFVRATLCRTRRLKADGDPV